MTSQPETLKAGDKIVPLAALATQCATISGALSLAAVLQSAGVSGLWVLFGVLLGAFAGLAVGWAFGRLAFPALASNVVVIRAGRAALPRTLLAAATPSFIVSLGLAFVAMLVLGAPPLGPALAWAAGCSASVACLFGFGSALA